MRKYRNIKTEYNGVVFDSRKECRRSIELEIMQRGGVISHLERQKAFELQPGYVNNKGEKIRPITYVADFYYYDKDRGIWVAEDVKSPATRQDKVYRIKKKMFEFCYPEIFFLET